MRRSAAAQPGSIFLLGWRHCRRGQVGPGRDAHGGRGGLRGDAGQPRRGPQWGRHHLETPSQCRSPAERTTRAFSLWRCAGLSGREAAPTCLALPENAGHPPLSPLLPQTSPASAVAAGSPLLTRQSVAGSFSSGPLLQITLLSQLICDQDTPYYTSLPTHRLQVKVTGLSPPVVPLPPVTPLPGIQPAHCAFAPAIPVVKKAPTLFILKDPP